MNLLLFLIALWTSKLISFLSKTACLGQGTNFAGKVALCICKNIIQKFKINKDCKIILVTGTNGKSTTTGLLVNILRTCGHSVIYNKSGANLLSGITNTLCFYAGITGRLNYNYIVLETDEAALSHLTKLLKADLIAVTNIFRDQLDRFGELDTTVRLITDGISNCREAILVLNADEPRLAYLNTTNKKVFFGLNTPDSKNNTNNSNNWLIDPAETTTCPECNSDLTFTERYIAHMGDYYCKKCTLRRPNIDFLGRDFKTDNLISRFDLISSHFNIKRLNFFIPFIGIFNLYNVICAIAIAKSVSTVTSTQIQKAIQNYSTIFGRAERINIQGKHCWIYLIKNPTGTTEVLKTLTKLPNARFLIGLNDNLADSRDVSWIWDARFELLKDHKKEIFISGKRAYDMALRLKYADINESQLKINKSIKKSVHNALEKLNNGETLFVLPTYTVLLEMQRKGLCKGEPL